MQTAIGVTLFLLGIIVPKLLAKALRRPASTNVLALYGAAFFLVLAALQALFVRDFRLEILALAGLLTVLSTGMLFVETRAKDGTRRLP